MSLLTPTGTLRAWWAVLMVLVAAFLVACAGVVYTNRVQREADLRWCALLMTLDQPQIPPTTDRGRRVQTQIHELRRSLGCGGGR